MTFYSLFQPFYLKYTLPPLHQDTMNDRFLDCRNKLKESGDLLKRPNGWACEVETSFSQSSNDAMDVNLVLQHYIVYSLREMGWPSNDYKLQSWYNLYGKNDYQESHNHIGYELSGVYFHTYDRDIHGSFRFINPFEERIVMAYPKLAFGSNCSCPSFFNLEEEPIVSSGDLIIFPSWLKHRVLRPCTLDMPKIDEYTDESYPKRITISFNVKMSDWL